MRSPHPSWLARLGLLPRSAFPALMFYGTRWSAFESIAPVLQKLGETDLRLSVVLCARDAALRERLRRRFPTAHTVSPPFALDLPTTIFLKRLRIRTVILPQGEALPGSTFSACLRKRSAAVVRLVGEAAPLRGPATDPGMTYIPVSEDGLDDRHAASIVEQLIPLLGKNRKWDSRQDRPIARFFARWLYRRMDDPAFAKRYQRLIRRYDHRDQLREALGHPKTILCLGNGPSSEDPRLLDISYDALFRVNHSWKERGILTAPDVVFTGGSSTMKALKGPIFGLQHQTGELLLLMTSSRRVHRHCLRYFSMERMGRELDDFDWGEHRPTNGAAMIAMAVALQPERLIIAGVDLFKHPDGSYPGDKQTPNAYTPAHSADKELSFICHSLDQLRGEVVIFGEILDREWRHFSERHRHHLDEVG